MCSTSSALKATFSEHILSRLVIPPPYSIVQRCERHLAQLRNLAWRCRGPPIHGACNPWKFQWPPSTFTTSRDVSKIGLWSQARWPLKSCLSGGASSSRSYSPLIGKGDDGYKEFDQRPLTAMVMQYAWQDTIFMPMRFDYYLSKLRYRKFDFSRLVVMAEQTTDYACGKESDPQGWGHQMTPRTFWDWESFWHG